MSLNIFFFSRISNFQSKKNCLVLSCWCTTWFVQEDWLDLLEMSGHSGPDMQNLQKCPPTSKRGSEYVHLKRSNTVDKNNFDATSFQICQKYYSPKVSNFRCKIIGWSCLVGVLSDFLKGLQPFFAWAWYHFVSFNIPF